jgi:hypothetical protein
MIKISTQAMANDGNLTSLLLNKVVIKNKMLECWDRLMNAESKWLLLFEKYHFVDHL